MGGVKCGWYMIAINGTTFSEDRFDAVATGSENYTITFATPQDPPVEPSPDKRPTDDCTSRLSEAVPESSPISRAWLPAHARSHVQDFDAEAYRRWRSNFMPCRDGVWRSSN